MAQIYEPKYDSDNVTLGYLKKIINEDVFASQNNSKKYNLCKNYGSMPSPPYSEGDTWTTNDKVYKCIKDRKMGSFSFDDWIVMYDKQTNNIISNSFQFLSSVELYESTDGKVETFYMNNYPSTNWLTDDEKSKHIGDYFQNFSNYKTYIYKYKNDDYVWEEVDVTTIIFEPSSGHRNIYLEKPDNYMENDIWKINNEEFLKLYDDASIGDFYKAIKTGTSFNKDDWKKINNDLSIKASMYSNTDILIVENKLQNKVGAWNLIVSSNKNENIPVKDLTNFKELLFMYMSDEMEIFDTKIVPISEWNKSTNKVILFDPINQQSAKVYFVDKEQIQVVDNSSSSCLIKIYVR